MSDAVERMLRRLDLTQGLTGERSTTWIGEAGEGALNMSNRLFGGIVVAQTIVAAGRTHATRTVHSVQQVFLRGGSADAQLEYRVERLFEGRTYASVRVEVYQGDHLISHAQVGVSSGIDGPDRWEPSAATTPLNQTVNRDELRQRPNWHDQPVELRVDPARADDSDPSIDNWMRPSGELPPDPVMHQAFMGYVSDRAYMNAAWKPHGDHGSYKGSTLDHSIWFHRPVDFNQWHVHSVHSPSLANGRGFIQGTIHTEAGLHIATTTQQGTFRATRRT